MRKLLGYTLHRLDVSGEVPLQAHWEGGEIGEWVADGESPTLGTVLGKELALWLETRLQAECGPRARVILWPVMEEELPDPEEPVLTYPQRTYTPEHTYHDLEKRGLA